MSPIAKSGLVTDKGDDAVGFFRRHGSWVYWLIGFATVPIFALVLITLSSFIIVLFFGGLLAEPGIDLVFRITGIACLAASVAAHFGLWKIFKHKMGYRQ